MTHLQPIKCIVLAPQANNEYVSRNAAISLSKLKKNLAIRKIIQNITYIWLILHYLNLKSDF